MAEQTQQSWVDNPRILVENYNHVLPTGSANKTENSNAVARLVILGTVVSFVLTMRFSMLIIGVACLLALAFVHRSEQQADIEGFVGSVSVQAECVGEEVVDLQAPTRANPLMNVMLTDYKDDVTRPAAAPAFNPVVEEEINARAADSELYPGAMVAADERSKLYQDLGDELVFDQSMRNFYAMPSTTIPNAQDAFAKYCYGDMPSCRSGDQEQCWKNVNTLQTRTA